MKSNFFKYIYLPFIKAAKTARWTVLIIWLIPLSACEDFLDVQPQQQVNESEAITNAGTAETAVNGLYNRLGNDGYYGANYSALSYLSGGDIQWTGSQGAPQEVVLHRLTADNSYVSNAWAAIYRTILSANYIIETIPGITDPQFTQAKRDQFLGEAHFIRALSYFDLARGWGGIKIVLTPTRTTSDQAGIGRSSLEETYAQVLSDLETAESLLPETTNRNRATKKTVWALRARYHLYQKEWEQAADYASRLINDTQNYNLPTPYSAFFAANAVATPESIFEIAFGTSFRNGHSNWWLPPAVGGRREWAPNPQLVTLLNDPAAGGNRKELIARTAPPGNLWYGKLYYRNPIGSDPAYVLRVAEQYLIRAEARARLNQLTDALNDINSVRTRAELTPLPAEQATSTDQLLLAIEAERRLEFAFETDRWFDLARTERIDDVLGITDPNKWLFPIPNSERLADPTIEQNPGY